MSWNVTFISKYLTDFGNFKIKYLILSLYCKIVKTASTYHV